MRIQAWDTETHLIKPGMPCPRLVCVTTATDGHRGTGEIMNREDGIKWFSDAIVDTELILPAHHAPYDLGVLCAEKPELIYAVYDAIDHNRVRDTLLRQKIIDNANGELKYVWDEELMQFKAQRYGLEFIVWRLLGRERAKGEDTWRLRYRELDGVPLSQWPQEAIDYAIMDAEDTFAMFDEQGCLPHPHGDTWGQDVYGEQWQMEAAWALHLASCWGMRCEPARVNKIREHFTEEFEKYQAIAKEHEFVRPNGTKDLKAIKEAITRSYEDRGEPVPQTDKGNVKTSKDILKETGHAGLLAVADMGLWQKRLTTYLPVIENGTSTPINPNYNAILETFRTSCSRPNVQNFPQKGGLREAFVPRKGWVYVAADYSTLEMRSLAQVCLILFGWSNLADALNDGRELHLEMAAEILQRPYEEVAAGYAAGDPDCENGRDRAKPANFGFPGGMGAKKFIKYAAGYGIHLTLEEAQALRAAFTRKWSEMIKYFEYCSGLITGGAAEVVEMVGSGMLRGDVPYTAVCNGFFQHLAAMGAKRAMYEVSKACYTDRSSPLYGSRPIAFIHDEIIIETPENGNEHEAAQELCRVMIEAMASWITDVPVLCDAVMMRRWYKGAKPVFVDGRLVPCKPNGRSWEADLSN